MNFYDYCRQNSRDELLREWDTEKNGGRTPSDVSFGSSAMAWWRCARGHSFPMRVALRTAREYSTAAAPFARETAASRRTFFMGNKKMAAILLTGGTGEEY